MSEELLFIALIAVVCVPIPLQFLAYCEKCNAYAKHCTQACNQLGKSLLPHGLVNSGGYPSRAWIGSGT